MTEEIIQKIEQICVKCKGFIKYSGVSFSFIDPFRYMLCKPCWDNLEGDEYKTLIDDINSIKISSSKKTQFINEQIKIWNQIEIDVKQNKIAKIDK